MWFSRRDAIRRAGLAGLLGIGSTVPADADSAHGGEHLYAPAVPGSRERPLKQRLEDRLSVLDFGARGDGTSDDTAAFQRAADASTESGKTLFIPATREGYRITDTVKISCRHVTGDANYIGPGARGTLIRFDPSSISDMKPCFSILDGMYASGIFENMTIRGIEKFSRERLSETLQPTLLPSYDAFAPGTCAIGVFGRSQPTFRNVSTSMVKVGLYLDSTNGHVSSFDCYWSGLFGVYCHRNSEDYFFMGGQIHGVFSCVVFGTFSHANHNGGFSGALYRVHMGFAPYSFYQVRDHMFFTRCQGISGRFDYVRFERVGESIFNLLPQSVSAGLSIDSFGMSWSPIHREFPSPQPSGWITNLPPDILPYREQQQYAMRFGEIRGNVNLSWLGDASVVRRSPYADNPLGIALFEYISCGDTANLSILRGDFKVNKGITADSWTRSRVGPVARQGDLMIDRGVAPAGNLLAPPETISNWSIAPDAVDKSRLTTLSIGGGDKYEQFGSNINSSEISPALTPPLAFLEELGSDPTILKFEVKSNGAAFSLPFVKSVSDLMGRSIYLSLWVFGGPADLWIQMKNGKRMYSSYIDSQTIWRKIVCVDQMPDDLIDSLVLKVRSKVCLMAGVMAALDAPSPYNPLNIPGVRGGLALNKFETTAAAPAGGNAAALPARPTGYLTIHVNGKPRQLPFY